MFCTAELFNTHHRYVPVPKVTIQWKIGKGIEFSGIFTARFFMKSVSLVVFQEALRLILRFCTPRYLPASERGLRFPAFVYLRFYSMLS